MTSYLVLEAPDGADPQGLSTRFVADRFSWLGFIVPWIWLGANRLWLFAVLAIVVQILAGALSTVSGFEVAGALCALTLALLTGFEGRNLLIRHLTSKGWETKDIIVAPDLATAENIHFSMAADEPSPETAVVKPEWKTSSQGVSRLADSDAAGLFQFDFSGRR
jgi:hypothetical protein